jgi:KDO2-lipid IV(A) lauroyltransferase
VNAVLESVIREYPEQWLWMHDRWKSARQRGLL